MRWSRIKKTVIGSFPRICPPIEDSIKAAVDLQIKYGIDIISDGEQRYDMINYFHQLPGLVKDGEKLYIGGRIESLTNPNDFIKIKDYNFVKEYLRGADNQEVKTTLTGPITLGMTCAINGIKGYYENVNDLRIYEALSESLSPIIVKLLELDSFIQIDEPGLSGGFMKPDIAVKIISNLLDRSIEKENWKERVSIHVCGNLPKVKNLFDELLNLDVAVLSLAFSGKEERENFRLLSKKKIERSDKRIGVGCINVQVGSIEEIDSIDTIYKRLREIKQIVGLENIAYIHPDCGLKNNSIEVIEKILENLDEISGLFSNE